MNKEEFLNKLRNSLKDLSPQEIEDNINEYDDYISEKVKSGKKEKDVIKDLGNYNDLVDEILNAYDFKKPKKGLEKYLKDFADAFTSVIDSFANKSLKGKLLFILEILCLILFIMVCHIPVNLLLDATRHLFDNFRFIGPSIYEAVEFIINVIYIIAAVYFIVYYFQKKLVSEIPVKKNNCGVKKKEDVIMNNKDIENEVKKKDDQVLNTVCNILLIFIKIFLGFILVGIGFAFIGLVAAFVISIITIFDGASYFSIPVLLLGSIAFIYGFIYIIIKLLFDKNIKALHLLISFGLAVVLSITGSVLVGFDIVKSDYVNGISDNYQYTYKEEVIPNTSDIEYDCYYCNINFDIDNTLTDTIIINTRSVKEFSEVNLITKDNKVTIEKNYHENDDEWQEFKDVVKLMYDNYKDHTYYNYNKLFDSKITITANEETIKILKENYKEHHDVYVENDEGHVEYHDNGVNVDVKW